MTCIDPECRAPSAAGDRYCGTCGAPLARLQWRSSNDGWTDQGGYLSVRVGTPSVRVPLRNQGSGPMALLVEYEANRAEWLDLSRRMLSPELRLEPGEELELEVDIDVAEVEAMFSPERTGSLQPDDFEAVLHLRSSLFDHDGNEVSARQERIRLRVARQPFLSPEATWYPLVSAELLDGEVGQVFTLQNESAEPITLVSTTITDTRLSPPAGLQRLPAAELVAVEVPAAGQEVVLAGARVPLDMRFLPQEGLEGARWFSFEISVALAARGVAKAPCRSLVEGIVGPGPDLRFPGRRERSIQVNKHPRLLNEPQERQAEVEVHNPGVVPVRVVSVELLMDGDAPVPTKDWLSLEGLSADEWLAPGEHRTLTLRLDPEARPPEELVREQCRRRIRIAHDGWPVEAADRQLEIQVIASFAAVQVATTHFLGIDFGTSNSMVCLFHSEGKAHPLSIELDYRKQLTSIMYFQCLAERQPDTPPFLVGELAARSLLNKPANAVRSVKTVVARDPLQQYHFICSEAGDCQEDLTWEAQELLVEFITELRRRAEDATAAIYDPSLRRELGLVEQLVKLQNAVFTHPVRISPGMKTALHRAATSAGLNPNELGVDDFFAQCCVDEATAAALAWVDGELADEEEDCSLADLERLVCVDVGGGTSDFAAIEIEVSAYYETGKLPVRLLGTDGDPNLGGDLFDRMLCQTILEGVGSRLEAAGVDLAFLRQCIDATNRDQVETRLVARLSQLPAVAQLEERPDPRQLSDRIWRKVQELITLAEKKKRELCSAAEVKVHLVESGWPLRPGAPETGAGPGELTVTLKQADFADRIRTIATDSLLPRLEALRKSAQWSWDDVTTVLFTGQCNRLPFIREVIQAYIAQQRSPEAAAPRWTFPGDNSGFDPKLCVAKGAAVWGESQFEGRWIEVDDRIRRELRFDLLRKVGRRRLAIPELVLGTAFPVDVELDLGGLHHHLKLYRGKHLYVQFSGFPPSSTVRILIDDPATYRLIAGDVEVAGRFIED